MKVWCWVLAGWLCGTTPAFAALIFWTDRGASQIKRMNFDGSDLRVVTLSGTVQHPGSNLRGIMVNGREQKIIWADNGSDLLFSANWDGSGSGVLLAIEGGNSFPADVRFDGIDRVVYWCDQQRRFLIVPLVRQQNDVPGRKYIMIRAIGANRG